MKANAKKLLALILAMVMCLSLAAPAMAASVDAAAEASLSLQASKVVKKITVKYDETGKKAVGANIFVEDDEATGTDFATATPTDVVLFKDVDNEGGSKEYDAVKVTSEVKTPAKVGQNSKKVYIVTPKSVYASDKDQKAKKIDADGTDDALKLKTDITFKDLSADKTLITEKFMAQGGYYGERQSGSSWKVFFKLNQLNKDGNGFDTKKDAVYAVAEVSDFAATPTSDQLKAALAAAKRCHDVTGEPSGESDTVWQLRVTPTKPVDSSYTYVVMDSDHKNVGDPKGMNTGDAISAISSHLWKTAGDTATYQVSATYQAMKADQSTEIKAEKDASKIEADLKEGLKNYGGAFEVTGVTAGTNGTFNVSVKKTSGYQASYYGKPGDNTAIYGPVNALGEGQIVLIDASKPGTYTPEKTEGKNQEKTGIDAGYKFKSECYAVKQSDVKDAKLATNTDINPESDGWYYFNNREYMLNAFKTEKCTVTKTLAYKRLVVYVQDGSTKNEGVKLENDGTVTVVDQWASKTGAATESGTITVGNNIHKPVAVKKTKAPTCKQKGAVTTVIMCADCEKVFNTSVESEIPVIEKALLKGDKDKNYVYTWTGTDEPDHYIPADGHESVIVKNDKNNTGTVTHKFKCNLGEYHEELEYTEDLKKANLEHSGRWDSFTVSTQNTQNARDPKSLYGYTFYVADTDVEYTNVAMIDGYKKFTFDEASLQLDGTYTSHAMVHEAEVKKLDANGKVLVDGKYEYEAFLTVKDIKVAEKDCLDGSATVEIQVFKLARAGDEFNTAEQRDEAVKNNKAALVSTHTKSIVVKAVKDHVDANNDGKCDNCGTEIKQVTPDVPTTDKVLTLDMVTVKNLTWTGKKQQPDVTVKAADGTELEEGIDYDVATFKKTDVGTYTITVKGKGDWTGKVKATVKIKKAANPIKVAKTSVSVKAKDVKKKAKTIALKVTKAQGKVTVKSSKKKVVSWKKNKITVAKAAKKGTYKLTFTAKGNKNYKKGTKTVKVVVK